MPEFDLTVSSNVERSPRVMQLEGMFDVPATEKLERHWHVKLPVLRDDPGYQPWQVGLVVAPSGGGKTRIARRTFGPAVDRPLEWDHAKAVIDGFDDALGIGDITDACTAVGFNTVPSWLKPFQVLSNGEQFRVSLARRLVEYIPGGPGHTAAVEAGQYPFPVVDEFTSVVDRQVAKIGAKAVAKFVRKRPGMEFVAVTCHYDVLDWLQPDWIYDPSVEDPARRFAWRSVQPRPKLYAAVGRVDRAAWRRFAAFHYMSASLVSNARCWGLWVSEDPDELAAGQGRLASFAGVTYQMVMKKLHRRRPIMRIARMVTLPDYQGLGLAYALIDRVAAAYHAAGCAVTIHPAHPAATRALDRSPRWACTVKPGKFGATLLSGDSVFHRGARGSDGKRKAVGQGGRPCATFRYHPHHDPTAPAVSLDEARALLGQWPDGGLPPKARERATIHINSDLANAE